MSFIDLVTNNPWSSAATFVAGFIILFYYYLIKEWGKFEKKGLFCLKPELFFGNAKDMYLEKKDFAQFHLWLYKQFEGHK